MKRMGKKSNDFSLLLFDRDLTEQYDWFIQTLDEARGMMSDRYKDVDEDTEIDKTALLTVMMLEKLLQYIEALVAYCMACQKDNSRDFTKKVLNYGNSEIGDFIKNIENLSDTKLNNILAFVDSSDWMSEKNKDQIERWMEKSRNELRTMLTELKYLYLFSVDAPLVEKIEESLNKGIISEELNTVFKIKEFSLSENATIMKERADKWELSNGEKIYIIKKEKGKLNTYNKSFWDTYHDFYNASKHGGRWWMCEVRKMDSDYRAIGIQWLQRDGSFSSECLKLEDLNNMILDKTQKCKKIMRVLFHNQKLRWMGNPSVNQDA